VEVAEVLAITTKQEAVAVAVESLWVGFLLLLQFLLALEAQVFLLV
jgi:hypothetical protein